MTATMDRPAYELVSKLQDLLDDSDQFTDSPDAPNKAYIWAIRELMEEFGGRRHRWSHPRCFDCDHSVSWHRHDECFICGCLRTESEVLAGKRDEELDDQIARAIRDSDDGCLTTADVVLRPGEQAPDA